MSNEILLIVTLVITYAGVLLFYKYFGKTGLFCWTAIATIAANIEVMLVVDAFGMEQTLGNILFASTFLVTDILSEMEGKDAAKKAVNLGIATSICFILISQSWFLYTPNGQDWAMPFLKQIFSNTPRMMLVGIGVYAVVQRFDVWAYHKWWGFTERRFGDRQKYLWLRNNGSTLISQLLNTLLFTFGAFYGTYEMDLLLKIAASSYVIFIITSLSDTPAVYLARRLKTS